MKHFLEHLASSKKYWLAAMAMAYLCLIVRAAVVPATHENGRHFIRGDGFSDQNVYSTVLWVRDFGFWESRLRAVLFYKGDGNKSSGEVYTHYPSYPDILVAAYASLLGTVSEPLLRTLPLALSFFFLYLVFLCYKEVFVLNDKERNLNLLLLFCSGYFIFWADNLHKHLHEYICLWSSIYLLWKYYQDASFSKTKVFLYFLPISFIATQCSFETYVIVATLVVGSSIAFEKSWRKIISPLNVYLGFLFLAGIFLHLYLNKLYFGNWSLVFEDMRASYMQRIGISDPEEKMTLARYLKLPLRFVTRQERYFFIPGWMLFFFLYLYTKNLKAKGFFAQAKFMWVLFAASISWYLFMSQHAYMHHFTAKHFGMIALVVAGPGWLWLADKLESYKNQKWSFPKLGFHLLNFYILAMGITQILWAAWWQFSLRYLFEKF
jgi:hypothetical protein